MNEPTLLTIRDIARELNVRIHRVKYCAEEYNIEPRQRAGMVRLWSRDDIPHFKSALTRIAGRRGVAHV